MDESNAEDVYAPDMTFPEPHPAEPQTTTSDEVLRATSINWALQSAQFGKGDVLTNARGFYLFITGQDPVVDAQNNTECTNVVLLHP